MAVTCNTQARTPALDILQLILWDQATIKLLTPILNIANTNPIPTHLLAMPSEEILAWAMHHSLISTSETTKANLAMATVLIKDLVAANKQCEVYFAFQLDVDSFINPLPDRSTLCVAQSQTSILGCLLSQ